MRVSFGKATKEVNDTYLLAKNYRLHRTNHVHLCFCLRQSTLKHAYNRLSAAVVLGAREILMASDDLISIFSSFHALATSNCAAIDIFDLQDSESEKRFCALVETRAIRYKHDTLEDQLLELVAHLHPGQRLEPQDRQTAITRLSGTKDLCRFGRWVYYPWRASLVHVLPQDLFAELRASRNRYRITPKEQQRLASQHIAVVGLSVGAASAVTMALEGVGGQFSLADFDCLALSNLNRLKAAVCDIGVNKAVLCARQMLEINPYLKINLFKEGLNDANIDTFLGAQDAPVQLLVEECDDLYIKALVREKARTRQIPVMMETSDRGMLDVERFDKEPQRPILHGLLGNTQAQALCKLGPKDKLAYVLRIVGAKETSPRLLASLFEANETLTSWPQLASAVALGGAVLTDTARRILLGESIASGRFLVQFDKLVAPGKQTALPDWSVLDLGVISLGPGPRPEPAVPETQSGAISQEEAAYLVSYASMAPSGGNAQPWRFIFRDQLLYAQIDADAGPSTLDFANMARFCALGAAVANIKLAASHVGIAVEEVAEHDPSTLQLKLTRGEAAAANLFSYIAKRVTNRRSLRPGQKLSASFQARIAKSAERFNAQALIIDKPDELAELSDILGHIERLRFLTKPLHDDLQEELKWTAQNVQASRDGIGLDTLELTPADRAGAFLATHWPAMQVLSQLDLGHGLKKIVHSPHAAAFVLLRMPNRGPSGFLQGGQAMQHVWLEATAENLAVNPLSWAIYLLDHVERDGPLSQDARIKAVCQKQRQRFDKLFGPIGQDAEIILMRLGHADGPSSKSLRKPVSQIFEARSS